MESFYLVGEPVLTNERSWNVEHRIAFGQVDLGIKILREEKDRERIRDILRTEYLGIIATLAQMEVRFRIAYAHPDHCDTELFMACAQAFNCRGVQLSEDFHIEVTAYPRDFTLSLPGITLISGEVAKLLVSQREGQQLLSSPFGEGGRVLPCGNTALVPSRIIKKGGGSQAVTEEDLNPLKKTGIRIATIPPTISYAFDENGPKLRPFFNDHLDRAGCLLLGEDERPHLVVDPNIRTIHWRGLAANPPWIPVNPKESLEKLRTTCEPLGITVHAPRTISVPYALNLRQFPDGRVLMTEGDDDVRETVTEIVGKNKVHTTPVPIRFFPIWRGAGIGCLVTEAPTAILKKQ